MTPDLLSLIPTYQWVFNMMMMDNNHTLVIALIIILFNSCNHAINYPKYPILFDSEGRYPDLNIQLEDIADIHYIKMDGEDEGVSISPTSGQIHFDEERKLIIVGNDLYPPFSLAVYNDSGHLIRTIGQYGRGPGEFNESPQFCYDDESGTITILNSDKIIRYSLNGELLGEKRIRVSPYTHLFLQDDNLILFDPCTQYIEETREGGRSHSEGKSLTILDANTLNETKSEDIQWERILNISQPSKISNICPTTEGKLISSVLSDTLFLLDHHLKLRPYIVDTRHNGEKGNLLCPTLDTKDYLFLFLIPKNLRDLHLFKYYAIRKTDHKVFSCGNKKLFSIKQRHQLVFNELMQTDSPSYMVYRIYYGMVKAALESNEEIPEELMELSRGMVEESNPILMIIRIK